MSRAARFVAAGLAVLALAPRPFAGAGLSAMDRLVLYANGRFDEAIAGLTSHADLRSLHDELVAQGGEWILAAADQQQTRRRLIAASFALEAASVDLLRAPEEQGPGFDAGEWPSRLVAWGAIALVQAVPSKAARTVPEATVPRHDDELVWFRAAAASLQAGPTYRSLIQPPRGALMFHAPKIFPLLELGLARFPNDPVLRLARAGAFQRTASGAALYGDRGPRRQLLLRAPTGPGVGIAESEYRRLVSNPLVAAEASLRLGFLRYLKGKESEARKLFSDADRLSTDRTTKYCARMLTAWAWARENRHDQAVDAYRSALELAPFAYSAAVPVAASLQQAGRLAEAEALLLETFARDRSDTDPLTWFDRADRRFLPERIAALRKVVAR